MTLAHPASPAAPPAWRFLAIVAALAALCGYVYFWPPYAIANVDDLFFVPWAQEFSASGRHYSPLLASQFPDLESYHLQPRLHLVLAGWMFRLVGTGTAELVLLEFLAFALTSLAFAALCLRLRLTRAALFTPLVFAPCYAVAGFRLELTGALLFVAGLLLLVPAMGRVAAPERGGGRKTSLPTVAGLALLGIAPLAAPAVFAWSLGAVVVLSVSHLTLSAAAAVRILAEGLAALAVALGVFAVSIDFEFQEFVRQFAYHASRSVGGGVNEEALLRVVLFAGAFGLLFRRRARLAALLCLMLAVGQGLAATLHDKALIRNLAAAMVFLLVIDAGLGAQRRRLKSAVLVILALVLGINFLSFRLFSVDAGNSAAVTDAYRADLAAGRRVFIDETMAQHYLDQQTGGALSWTWGGLFPKGRPTGIDDLQEGDVWYLSEYTLLGYLKGRHDLVGRIWDDPDYDRVPQIPCVLGRQSCNLPEVRWTMLRIAREGGAASVETLGSGIGPRPLRSR